MTNAFSRMGRMCASVIFGGALLAGSLFAGQTVYVTLPHAVTVGSTTLPSGQYSLTTLEMSDGNEYFFHNSACTATRFDDLREGQAVTFERGQGPKGPRGENVRVA